MRDPESLEVHSLLFNLIMCGKDGLSSSERELGALGASIANHCVHCVALHASRFVALTERSDVIENIFANERDPKLEPRQHALFDFSNRLSTTPIEAEIEDANGLTGAGLTEVEQLDLVLSTAILGWTNRLTQSLGETLA